MLDVFRKGKKKLSKRIRRQQDPVDQITEEMNNLTLLDKSEFNDIWQFIIDNYLGLAELFAMNVLSKKWLQFTAKKIEKLKAEAQRIAAKFPMSIINDFGGVLNILALPILPSDHISLWAPIVDYSLLKGHKIMRSESTEIPFLIFCAKTKKDQLKQVWFIFCNNYEVDLQTDLIEEMNLFFINTPSFRKLLAGKEVNHVRLTDQCTPLSSTQSSPVLRRKRVN